MNTNKLIHQLFIGKVSEVLGIDKTSELLKEAKEDIMICNCTHTQACKICGKEKCLDGDFLDSIK
jgi:hypothetical protein